MIAVDTNVLIYAHRRGLPLHEPARHKLIALGEGEAPWAIPVFCLSEFARVVSHPKFLPCFSTAEACDAIARLLASPSLHILRPGERFMALFLEAMREARATGNLVFDAQIVAVCRENGVRRLLTEDRDFRRFDGFATTSLE